MENGQNPAEHPQLKPAEQQRKGVDVNSQAQHAEQKITETTQNIQHDWQEKDYEIPEKKPLFGPAPQSQYETAPNGNTLIERGLVPDLGPSQTPGEHLEQSSNEGFLIHGAARHEQPASEDTFTDNAEMYVPQEIPQNREYLQPVEQHAKTETKYTFIHLDQQGSEKSEESNLEEQHQQQLPSDEAHSVPMYHQEDGKPIQLNQSNEQVEEEEQCRTIELGSSSGDSKHRTSELHKHQRESKVRKVSTNCQARREASDVWKSKGATKGTRENQELG